MQSLFWWCLERLSSATPTSGKLARPRLQSFYQFTSFTGHPELESVNSRTIILPKYSRHRKHVPPNSCCLTNNTTPGICLGQGRWQEDFMAYQFDRAMNEKAKGRRTATQVVTSASVCESYCFLLPVSALKPFVYLLRDPPSSISFCSKLIRLRLSHWMPLFIGQLVEVTTTR